MADFPTFISLEFDGNTKGLDTLTRVAAQSGARAGKEYASGFETSAAQIGDTLTKALSIPRNAGGSLDLSSTIRELQQAEKEATSYSLAAKELARAQSLVVQSSGAVSREQAQEVRLLNQISRERGNEATSIALQISAYDRLQAALFKTNRDTERLAQTQRELRASDTGGRQSQVRTATAQEFFQAPQASATSQGASFSALAARDAIDELRRAESDLIEQERILQGIHRNTGLEQGRIANSARASAQAFAEYDRNLENLQQTLNPLFFAQKSANEQIDFAAQALKRGDISAAQYQQAVTSLNATLGRQVSAFGATRQAFVQTGQQIQDLGISLISGQRASTVFAQQLPQLAFALTSLEGSSNKTQNAIGRFAAILSGPLGSVGLVAASFGIGILVDWLFKTEEASKDAEKASYDFTKSFDIQKIAIGEVANAMANLNDQTSQLIEGGKLLADQSLLVADNSLRGLEARRDSIRSEIQKLNSELKANFSGFDIGSQLNRSFRLTKLKENLSGVNSSIDGARTAVENARIAASQLRINEALDKGTKIQNDYNRSLIELEKLRRAGVRYENEVPFEGSVVRKGISETEYERRFKALKQEFELQKKLNDERERKPRRSSEALPEVTDREVAGLIGFSKFGGRRSVKRNDEVGGAKNSFHLIGQAVDIPIKLNGEPLTKAGIRKSLESAGVIIKELLGPGDKGHSDHFHVGFSKKRGNPAEIANDQREQEQKRTEELSRLSQVSQRAANDIRQINAQFDDQPRLVDQSANAVSRLQKILSELGKKENQGTPGLEELKSNAESAITVAQNAVATDFARQTDGFNDRLRIQKLILAGREDEAAIAERLAQTEERYGVNKRIDGLQQILKIQNEILAAEDSTQTEREAAAATIKGTSSEYEKLLKFAQDVRKTTADQYLQEKALQEAIDKRTASVQRYQSLINGTYSGLENLLSGGSAKDFFKGFQEQFRQLQGQNLTEQLFGDSFRQLKKFSERNNPENVAVRDFVERMKTAETSVDRFAKVLTDGADRISGAANDNGAPVVNATGAGAVSANSDIVVTGQIEKALRETAGYTADQFSLAVSRSIVDPLLTNLNELLGVDYFTQLSGVLSGALSGFQRAGTVGGILGGAQGLFEKLAGSAKEGSKAAADLSSIADKLGEALQGAQTGDQVALLGRSFGIKTSRTGGQLGGAAGKLIGPLLGPVGTALGPIVGGAIGSIVGGLFKKTKQGSTTINSLSGDLAFSGSGGLRDGVLGAGGSVRSGLSNIIEQLGGTAGQFAVSIGQRKKDFVVDPTGKGRTKGAGVLKFKTEEEAIRAALLDAIRDGAVKGVTDGARRLLEAGKDLDAQLAKAVRFQSVFDRLKAVKDPIGAALGTLNREFEGLISVFNEAGASATEFAQLEELYGIERARVIKETSDTLTSSLRGLIDDLKTGDNGLALRDRLSNTRAQFDPLAADIRAGRTVDYDKFAEVSRELIDIQRQISGSQSDYFATFNEVLGLSEGALRNQTNVVSIGANGATPFGPAATAASNDNTPVVSAINSQTNSIVAGLQAVQAQIAANGNLRQSIFGSSATAIDYQLPGGSYF